MKLQVTIILIALLLWSGSAFAQSGVCPPGFYSSGTGQGVIACAPFPGGTSGDTEGASSVPRTKAGYWSKRWGAIVVADESIGVSVGEKNKREAIDIATEGARDLADKIAK